VILRSLNPHVIKVDTAWDESWSSTEQIRYYRIEGDRLHIEAALRSYANFGGKVMHGILIWAYCGLIATRPA